MARAPGRWLLVRAALAEESRAALVSLRRLLAGPRFPRVPDRLLFAPQDLRIPDPAIAAEMASGIFVFADRTVRLPAGSPFRIEPPDEGWTEELYGFGWLRHLRSADGAAVRASARALVGEAIGPLRRDLGRGVPRRTPVVARRLISFLAHSPLLMNGADHAFYRRCLQAIGRDAAALGRDLRGAPRPLDRLQAAIGLCFAGLCCGGLESVLRRGTRILAVELDAQILPDGGHVGRDPAVLVDLLLDLMPLRLLFGSRNTDVPAALDAAIARAMPMLRFFQHGSGDLALFNGMGRTALGELATLLAHASDYPAPGRHAAASGYDRLEAAGTLAIVDTGRAPPLPASGAAHAGWLSFELSSGLDRIVVNRGAPAQPGPAREAAREARAHSTLVLNGESAGRILHGKPGRDPGWPKGFVMRRFGPVLLGGPDVAGSELGADAVGNVVLTAHHDGYRAAHGALHARRLVLTAAGDALLGEDRLTFGGGQGAAGAAARILFHLHPSVRSSLEGTSGEVVLDLAGGERWIFAAEGATPSLRDDVFHAVTEGRRPGREIVLRLRCPPGATRAALRWSFRRSIPAVAGPEAPAG